MHGIIFSELRAFAESLGGPAAWAAICAKAGLAGNIYAPFGSYPDEEVVRLVMAASAVTGRPAQDLLIDFGVFIAPHLLELYKHRISPSWSCFDLLEHTEETIHEVLRSKDPHASPPRLVVTRLGPDAVIVEYTSGRKLCAVAKGIIRGLGTHYSQPLDILETSCMHAGDARCVIEVRGRSQEAAALADTP